MPTVSLTCAHSRVRVRAEKLISRFDRDLASMTPQDVRDLAEDEFLLLDHYLLLRAWADILEHDNGK